MNVDIFAFATRQKVRFVTPKGNLNTEDLWDLPLITQGDEPSIDSIGKAMAQAVSDNKANESFVVVKDAVEDITLKVKLKILEHIRDHKVDYAARATLAAATNSRKQRLVELLAKKRDDADGERSIDDIEKMIAEL